MHELIDIDDKRAQMIIKHFNSKEVNWVILLTDYSINVLAEIYNKSDDENLTPLFYFVNCFNQLKIFNNKLIPLDKKYDKFYNDLFSVLSTNASFLINNPHSLSWGDLTTKINYIILFYNFLNIGQEMNYIEQEILNGYLINENDIAQEEIIARLEYLSEIAVEYKERINSWIIYLKLTP